MYLVRIWATEYKLDKNDNIIWYCIWGRQFDMDEEAILYMKCQNDEFDRRATFYKRNGDKWELINDTRYY